MVASLGGRGWLCQGANTAKPAPMIIRSPWPGEGRAIGPASKLKATTAVPVHALAHEQHAATIPAPGSAAGHGDAHSATGRDAAQVPESDEALHEQHLERLLSNKLASSLQGGKGGPVRTDPAVVEQRQHKQVQMKMLTKQLQACSSLTALHQLYNEHRAVLNPIHLSSIAGKLVSLHVSSHERPTLRRFLRTQFVPHLGLHLISFPPRVLATVGWSLACLQHVPPEFWMGEWYAACARRFDSFSTRDLSQCVYAVAMLNNVEAGGGLAEGRYAKGDAKPVLPTKQWIELLSTYLGGSIEQCNAQDVSNALYSMVYLLPRPLSATSKAFLAKATEHTATIASTLKPQEMSNLLWAVAKIGFNPGKLWLNMMVDHIATALPLYAPRHYGNILWALSSLHYSPAEHHMLAIANSLEPKVAACNGTDMANIMRSFNRLHYIPPEPVRVALLSHALATMESMHPNEAMMVMWGVVRMSRGMASKEFDAAVFSTLDNLSSILWVELSPSALVSLLHALTKLEGPAPPSLLEAAGKAVEINIEDFDLHNLSMALRGLTWLKYEPRISWSGSVCNRMALLMGPPSSSVDIVRALWHVTLLGGLRPSTEWSDAVLGALQPRLPSLHSRQLSRITLSMQRVTLAPSMQARAAFLQECTRLANLRVGDRSSSVGSLFSSLEGQGGDSHCERGTAVLDAYGMATYSYAHQPAWQQEIAALKCVLSNESRWSQMPPDAIVNQLREIVAMQGERPLHSVPLSVTSSCAAEVETRILEFEASTLSQILWSWAKLGFKPKAASLALIRDRVQSVLISCSPSELLRMVWALSFLSRYRPSVSWCDDVLRCVMSHQDKLTVPKLLLLVKSFARMQFHPSNQVRDRFLSRCGRQAQLHIPMEPAVSYDPCRQMQGASMAQSCVNLESRSGQLPTLPGVQEGCKSAAASQLSPSSRRAIGPQSESAGRVSQPEKPGAVTELLRWLRMWEKTTQIQRKKSGVVGNWAQRQSCEADEDVACKIQLNSFNLLT